MDQLLISRDADGDLQLAGTGHVSLRIEWENVLGHGGQGVVFLGKILDQSGTQVIREVAIKIPKVVHDPHGQLRAEGGMHAQAWSQLDHVLMPLGYLAAHDETGSPAMIIMEIGMPFATFLSRAGPLGYRHFAWIKAITRIIFQANNLELVELAVGDFGAAQWGVETEGRGITYRAGVYTWDDTSARMVSAIYDGTTAQGISHEEIHLDRQLCLYNDLFGWARIAFVALADRPPPDVLSGPTAADYAQVPELGFGDVLDGVRHVLRFALDLLTPGSIGQYVDAEYITSFEWYPSLSEVLAGDEGSDQALDTAGIVKYPSLSINGRGLEIGGLSRGTVDEPVVFVRSPNILTEAEAMALSKGPESGTLVPSEDLTPLQVAKK